MAEPIEFVLISVLLVLLQISELLAHSFCFTQKILVFANFLSFLLLLYHNFFCVLYRISAQVFKLAFFNNFV